MKSKPTGVFDIENKEICVGDIVEFDFSFKKYPWHVIWDNESKEFKIADSADDAYWLKLSQVKNIKIINRKIKHK